MGETINPLFEDLIGQNFAKQFLSSVLSKKKLNTAYLFSGPNGVGKKLAAFRFIEGLLNNGSPSNLERIRLESMNHPDLLWVEPTYSNQGKIISRSIAQKEGLNQRSSSQIRLVQIRELTRFLGKKPLEAKGGIIVIEDLELIREEAANALLKILEEPRNGLFILLTSRPEKILETIKSRCQKVPFYSLNEICFQKVLMRIKSQPQSSLPFELSNTLDCRELINMSNGCPGELIVNLKVWENLPEDLLNNLFNLPHEPIGALTLAREITEKLNHEEQVWIIKWLEESIWHKTKNDLAMRRLEKLHSHLLSYVNPRLAWELALIELIQMN